MGRITFLIFYQCVEYIKEIYDEMEKQGWIINCIPVFQLREEGFLELEIAEKTVTAITENASTHLFFFLLPFYEEFYVRIRQNHPNVKFIFYNIDDPCSLNSDLLLVGKRMDFFINTNPINVNKLELVLEHKVDCVYDYCQTQPHLESNYIYDIIFVCDDNCDLKYNVKQMVTDLKNHCINNNYQLAIFGPEKLEQTYPDIYLGAVDNLQEICSQGKLIINLNNTHDIVTKPNKNFMKIIMGGHLLLTNVDFTNRHLLHPGVNCLKLDTDFKKTIDIVLKRYDDYRSVKANAIKENVRFGIGNWCQELVKIIT